MNRLLIKRFDNLPFAHRQHTHEGHCRLVHGHNWSFEFAFSAAKLDQNGFVIDFGALKWLRQWLYYHFDHTIVLCASDPQIEFFRAHDDQQGSGIFRLRELVNGASAESIAAFVFRSVQEQISERTSGRVELESIRVFEDEKNSVIHSKATTFHV